MEYRNRNQPAEIVEALKFLIPVREVLEGADQAILDALPHRTTRIRAKRSSLIRVKSLINDLPGHRRLSQSGIFEESAILQLVRPEGLSILHTIQGIVRVVDLSGQGIRPVLAQP